MGRVRRDHIWWNKPCERCGYNLRGLSGDPCRCPECGLLNPRRLPRYIAAQAEARAGSLSRPLLVASVAICWLLCAFNVSRMGWWEVALCLVVLALVQWTAAVRTFARRCHRRVGWVWVAVRYHVAAVLSAAAIVAHFETPGTSWWTYLSTCAGLSIIGAVWLWAYARLRAFARTLEFEVLYGQIRQADDAHDA